MPVEDSPIASHNPKLLDVGAYNLCIHPIGGSQKKYLPGIKMLYFCDTFWMRRDYLVVSKGVWQASGILINSVSSLPLLKSLNL